ncbi:septal ring lytic transglycosylase RlpA family protein [Mesorhizobium sp. BAC0120]|uniref:septal ring lytic transglycosylase RlpA family protein n=1 Tax=Mesorhizobium sp. BAC0120 TaxID=3090670 RepID=UPI00298C52B5|nr:septal ring lytic transglycosylase RlpA family protein [Mesorhizobium sp. BAC0120]MDW6022965.1 septal ring lytic transglycosylase RlpA family protein [Mesorhizobium sp. BAC0120]
MPVSTRSRLKTTSAFIVFAASAAFLTACSTTHENSMRNPKRSKEYFAESEYGVKASPRVTTKRSRLPRGGGRDQLGQPYKVAGKWYYPKEDRHYKKVGAASWYGDAFHGRLTANGEIYDQTHLTAAHPTMPLPSYARVTNLLNGSSVIVRVNDRGPYAHDRVIDLSRRAAEMLDYSNTGIAKVKVEYVGRAPLDGEDDAYLLASYRPGKGTRPEPSDGLPTGVMVAMNGTTPSAPRTASAAAFPGVMSDAAPAAETVAYTAAAAPAEATPVAFAQGFPELPAFGPIFPDRPANGLWPQQNQQVAGLMSYADGRVKRAASPFDAMGASALTPDSVVASLKRQNSDEAAGEENYVAVGTFADKAKAEQIATALKGAGRIGIERSEDSTGTWYSVTVRSDGKHSIDDILQAAWDNGAPDALAVRN